MKMKASSKGLNIIAREMALDFADGAFKPELATHISGLSNKCADILSRKHQPNTNFQFPFHLNSVKEFKCPPRDRSFYKALLPPSADRKAEQ